MHFSTSFALLGLVALGSSHIVINTPVPFKESVTNNFNGPLSQVGDDFPCKAKGVYTPQGASTQMPLGSSQALKFTGSAVHGGGSCQISITYDKAPTPNSVWKVIHSIVGGCPISAAGNLPGDANLATPGGYQFTIPKDLPAGEAVLAWTWFNRIGNREMYMNCAPITITAGSTRRDEGSLLGRNATQLVERDIAAYNSLPNMYVANTSKDCLTPDNSMSIEFPNPGSSVEKDAAAIGGFTPALACGDKSGSAAGPNPTSSVSPAPATSAAAPVPTSSSGSVPGGVFFPVPDSSAVAPSVSAAPTAAPVSSIPASSSAPVQAPSPTQATTLIVVPTPSSISAAPPAGTGTVGGGSQLTGPCPTEGSWNCIGGTSFQRCASGNWSVAMAVAAGTQCTSGESASLAMNAIPAKRNIRFSGAHIRRHLQRS